MPFTAPAGTQGPDAMSATASANVSLTPGGSDNAATGSSDNGAQVLAQPTGTGSQMTNWAFASVALSASGRAVWTAFVGNPASVAIQASGGDSGPQPPNLPDYANVPASVVGVASGLSALTVLEASPVAMQVGAAGTTTLTLPVQIQSRYYYTRQRAGASFVAQGTSQAALTTNQTSGCVVSSFTNTVLTLPAVTSGAGLLLTASGTSARSYVDLGNSVASALSASGTMRFRVQEAQTAGLLPNATANGLFAVQCVSSALLTLGCPAQSQITHTLAAPANLAVNAPGKTVLGLVTNTAANAALSGGGSGSLRACEKASANVAVSNGADWALAFLTVHTSAGVVLGAG